MTNHAFECLNVCWGKNLSSVSVHDMISTNLYDQKNVSGIDVFTLSITGMEVWDMPWIKAKLVHKELII